MSEPAWLKRALDPNSPIDKKWNSKLKTRSTEHPETGKEILYPKVRMLNGKLIRMSDREAELVALNKGDYLEFNSPAEATTFAQDLSERINKSMLKIKKKK